MFSDPPCSYTLRKEHVLVTGGAGFIGSHLVEKLYAAQAQVTVVDNLRTGRLENLQHLLGKIEFVQMDLLSSEFLKWLRERQFTSIFHLAANAYVPPSVKDPVWDFEQNLFSTFRLLENLRQENSLCRFIYASSAAVYGDPIKLPMLEEDPTFPISPYGVSKLAAERYVAVYAETYGLQAASIRIFSTYGPRHTKQVVYDLIERLHTDPTRLEILGDGSQKRDLVYVEDVANAFIHVAQYAPLRGETFNVASGTSTSIAELVRILCESLKVSPTLQYSGKVRPGDPQEWIASIDRLREINFAPSVDLKEGILRTIEWYKRWKK